MEELFFELHEGLPQQGPGSDACTRRAYEMLGGLPGRPKILDIGCGPGRQTRALVRLSGGHIIAVDTHEPFLQQIRESLAGQNEAPQVETLRADMSCLPLEDASFDLVWSEGAIYLLGFERGLREWKRLLKPGGYLAVTELSWFLPEPPEELFRFWKGEYPAITSIAENLRTIDRCGYGLAGHFSLPESAWWEGYYTPLEGRLESFSRKYPGNPQAERILEMERQEIELFRKYSSWFGYEFYLMRNRV